MTKYSIDESKSLHETYTKEELDEVLETIPTSLEEDIKALNDDIDYLYEQLNTLKNKEVVLWSGTSRDANITLSESSANFTYIEIFYDALDSYRSLKVYKPNGKRVDLTGMYYDGANTRVHFIVAGYTFSGISLNFVSNSTTCKGYDFDDKNLDTEYSNQVITIRRIVGYR